MDKCVYMDMEKYIGFVFVSLFPDIAELEWMFSGHARTDMCSVLNNYMFPYTCMAKSLLKLRVCLL